MVALYIFIIGLCLGSFVNALVWRTHEQEEGKQSSKRRKDLSVLNGRSMCPHCRHTLSAADLIPVISWVRLQGRCRYCKQPIAWQYPIVELLTGSLALISYLAWPYGYDIGGYLLLAAWLILLTGFIALIVYDLRWMLLPNRIVYPLLGLWTMVTIVHAAAAMDMGIITAALMGVVSCGGIFWVLFQVSDGRWIGGGDVKLGFLLGMLVGGPLAALLVIFLSSLLGTLYIMPLLMIGRVTRSSRIPFGPFLIGAAIMVYLLGDELLNAIGRVLLIT